MRSSKRAGTVLADAAKAVPRVDPKRVDRVGSAALLDAAAHHRLAGLLQDRLQAVDVEDRSLHASLAAMVLQARAHHQRAVADVFECGDVLDAHDIPWLVVKGPVLAEAVYRQPGVRWYGDIDFLVPRAAFANAVAALRGSGAPLQDQNWLRVRREEAGQLNLLAPGGTPLDLHWHIVFGAEERARRGIDMDGVFERARTVHLGGREVRTTGTEDTLLHVAMHASQEGADRLVWLKDVEQVVTNWGPDWDALVSRAAGWQVAPAVALVLGRTQRILGLELPPDVIPRLVPSVGWRALYTAADRLSPIHQSGGRTGSVASLVAKSTGATAGETAGRLVGRLAGRLRWIVRTRSLARPLGGLFPEDLGSPYVATGSEDDLEAFLAGLGEGET